MIYNPFPSIELPFGKDNIWFVYLFESIMKVDSSFIMYTINVKEGGVLDTNETRTHLERVFAYELYRQWMNCLELHGVRNLVVNGEIGKYLKGEFEIVRNDANDKTGKDNYPDLVLHKSQGNDELQIMVCEIKREGVNDSDLFLDLYKLSCYINEKIFWKKPFAYGVFIIEGKDANLKQLKIKPGTTTKFKNEEISIEKYISDEKYTSQFSNIICVSYDGVKIEYETLNTLIKDIIKV